MQIGEIDPGRLTAALAGTGITFRTGPFVIRLRSSLPEIASAVGTLYLDFPVSNEPLIDFHVELDPARSLSRQLLRQTEFLLDGEPILAPHPRRSVVALLEWGLNACIYFNAHQFLVVHSAAVAHDDTALLFPGTSGTGKSTLCAALVCSGWRLISDELAIIRPDDGMLVPITRPISLKNESIDLIRRFAPEASFGPTIRGTIKGTMTHMRPPSESVAQMDSLARPRAVVFIEFQPEAKAAEILEFPKGRAFYQLGESSLNYHIRGADGFIELSRLIDGCNCYMLRYSSLDDAIDLLRRLV